MAIPSVPRLAILTVRLALAAATSAAGKTQLVEAINAYRSQIQSCGGQTNGELPPLATDPRLALPANTAGNLQQATIQAVYPMANAQSISLSGSRDAGAAMKTLQESFCRVVLDLQFVDVGVNRQGRDQRIVLTRPLLHGGMGSWQAEGQKLLERINTVHGQTRQHGGKPYAATQPLTWNTALGGAAEVHSRAMTNGNSFDHLDHDDRTPGDRTELAGYSGGLIGENVATGQDGVDEVIDGWLASPGHCANLMNPGYRELGATYVADPKSDTGIYWTAMLGSPWSPPRPELTKGWTPSTNEKPGTMVPDSFSARPALNTAH